MNALGPLFEARFDGTSFDSSKDGARLSRQLVVVRTLMLDGAWRTLADISTATGAPPASVSARLRDLRKSRFGGFRVERKRIGAGLFAYRVTHPGVNP